MFNGLSFNESSTQCIDCIFGGLCAESEDGEEQEVNGAGDEASAVAEKLEKVTVEDEADADQKEGNHSGGGCRSRSV